MAGSAAGSDNFGESPIIHRFTVVEFPTADVPACALECRPKKELDESLIVYQYFAMVDDSFSTVAFGKSKDCFHIAFKPDDWKTVEKQYPPGTELKLEMYPISGQDMADDTQASVGTRDSTAYGDHDTALVEEEIDYVGLKTLINDIVDEMTEPIQRRMDRNKVMIDEIFTNQKQRYDNLPHMIEEEIEKSRIRRGSDPSDTHQPACRCTIS